MKKSTIIILSLFLTMGSFAQFNKDNNNNLNNIGFDKRKEKGYYSNMQISLLLGNSTYSMYASNYSYLYTSTKMSLAPSFTITNGYMFNNHWTAGAGVGFEIFDHNLFPLFAEVRYTLWDSKISPFVTMKGGYSFGNFKAKHYDDLYLNWSPYYVNDASLRHYGGIMLNPEIGVKVPLNENCDLLFTVAYRHQKTKSIAKKDYESSQFDEWEHKEDLNRISFGIAIMFR